MQYSGGNMLSQHIKSFCQSKSIREIKPDQSNTYHLNFAGGHTVECFEISGISYMQARVTSISPKHDESQHVLAKLMKISLGLIKDSSAVLNLSDDGTTIMMHRRFSDNGHKSASFEEALEAFLNTLEMFKANVTPTQRRQSMPEFMFMRP